MKRISGTSTILVGYFAFTGVCAHVVLALALWYAYDRYDFGPRELARTAVEQAEKRIPAVAALLRPSPRHLEHTFDGRLRAAHPRILLPQLTSWDGRGQAPILRERDRLYPQLGIEAPPPCARDLPGRTACWLDRGDAESLRALLEAARAFEPARPDDRGNYGNAWELALAYDFLRLAPAFGGDDRTVIEDRLEQSLIATLELLDGPSPSLWHGRSTLAATAWLIAIVLDPDDPDRIELQRRAQGHFLDVMQAWRLSEAWPEGYNYWVQSRAFLLTLAASAWLNGLEDAAASAWIRATLRRSGYWHIHAARPDHRAEGFGDEGSRVDLRDETRRVIDLIAQATRDPVIAEYSRYLQGLHSNESYFRDYRWGFRLFNDPTVATPASAHGQRAFRDALPAAEIFGRDALNLAYIRSGHGDDATFIAFRAGHAMTHHGHYDAGHFTLFKGAPLAVNSSTYGDFTGPNRLHYSIRSIAKNTLLILRPGERVRPNHLFTQNVSDGGQRVTLPTGSGLRDVDHWRENLDAGLHLRGGTIERFGLAQGDIAYVRADLTAAYNTPAHDEGGRNGKVTRVLRELAYLFDEDRLVVHDRVVSVDPDYVKKWLLHAIERPEIADTRILRGTADDGVLESTAAVARVKNGTGHLQVQRLLPADAVIRLVGGPGHQYYVEADGDERVLDGANFVEGALHKPWFDVANWRIEIQPATPRREDRFLVALSPSVGAPREELLDTIESPDNLAGLYGRDSVLVFVERPAAGRAAFIAGHGARILRVLGLPPGTVVHLRDSAGAAARECLADAAGYCRFALPDGPRRDIAIDWDAAGP